MRLLVALSLLVLAGCAAPGRDSTSLGFPGAPIEPEPVVWSGGALSPASKYDISPLYPIPAAVADTSVNFDILAGVALQDFARILSHVGVNLSFDESVDPQQQISIPVFSGRLGDLIPLVSANSGLAFEYRNGSVLLSKYRSNVLRLPQDADTQAVIREHLVAFGVEKIIADPRSSTLVYRATFRDSELINSYLASLLANSVPVRYQLALLELTVNSTDAYGLDPSNFVATISSGLSGGPSALTIADGLASFVFSGSSFQLSGFVDALSTVGSTRIDQNLVVSTHSGKPVNIRTGVSVPFVSGITLERTEDSTLQSIETDRVNSGLNVEITPLYDAVRNRVTSNVTIELKNVIQMLDLSAGESVINQPLLSDTLLTTTIELSPGDTAILGGVVIDNENSTDSGIFGRATSSRSDSTRTVLYLAVRPTL